MLNALTQAATSEAVQKRAMRLAQNVYSRVTSGKNLAVVTEDNASTDAERLEQAVRACARTDDMVASFALLQAQIQQNERNTTRILVAIGVAQALTIILMFLR